MNSPIVHITPREAALQRENERLTDKTERQSATIHVQAVAIQAMTEELSASERNLEQLTDELAQSRAELAKLKADKKLLEELLSVLIENGEGNYSDETAITYMNMYVGEAAMKEQS